MATTVLGLKTFAASDPVDYNEINDNYNKIDNGVKTALQGRAEHNLLDNSDFTNPIAQAGLNGMHGSTKYVCDRWISWDANATFGSGYITPGSQIDQNLSKTVVDITKTYTAAICLSDGTIKAESGTFSNGFGSYVLGIYCMKQEGSTDYVTVRLNSGNNIRWAALYEGSYTAETLPAYQPNGYAAELAECQRYFTRIGNSSAYGIISGTECVVKIPLPTTMRNNIVPTITLDSALWAYSHEGYVRLNYAGATYSTNTASLHFTVDTTMSARSCVVPDLSCNISADL